MTPAQEKHAAKMRTRAPRPPRGPDLKPRKRRGPEEAKPYTGRFERVRLYLTPEDIYGRHGSESNIGELYT